MRNQAYAGTPLRCEKGRQRGNVLSEARHTRLKGHHHLGRHHLLALASARCWSTLTSLNQTRFPLNVMKREWSLGKINARRVQDYACRAANQGARDLDAIAGMGSEGRYAANDHRSLMQLFGNIPGAPPIDWLDIPTKKG